MRPKTLFRLLTVVILAVLWPLKTPPASSDSPAIGFYPIAVTVKTGQTFYLTAEVQAVTDLYAWQRRDYNEANLELISVSTGPHSARINPRNISSHQRSPRGWPRKLPPPASPAILVWTAQGLLPMCHFGLLRTLLLPR
jgi:hypothetical protein